MTNQKTAESTTPTVALLNEAAFRALLGAGAIESIVARGREGGFVLALKVGSSDAILGNSFGKPRLFASANTIALLLKRMGRTRFEVDSTDFVPGRIREAQPERSAAMLAGKLPKAATPRTDFNTKETNKK